MAAMNKLNGRAVDTARIDAGEKMLSDGGNLYLRVRPESRAWVFNYTAPNGKRRKMILGDYPTHSLLDARAWASEQRRLLGEGVDPAAARDAASAAARAPATTSKTVGDLLDTYRDSLIGKASHRQVSNVLKNHVGDSLRKLPLATVTKADLAAPIRKLKDAGKLRTAGLLHSYIMRAFTLAHDAHENPDAPAAFVPFTMTSNPVADMKQITGGTGETHEQVMTITQLREYATALQGRPQSAARDTLLLSLYCGGQRLAQVARATMEGNATMVIMDGKGKRTAPRRHALPLIGPASGIAAPGLSDNRAVDNLVDAATSIIEKISGGAYTQRVIRRTIENLLFDAGFSPSDTGLLLSHGLSGVQYQHYLRGDKLELKTRMLQCLHEMLAATE
jgi:hypothetical protein